MVRDAATCFMCGIQPGGIFGGGRLNCHHIYPKALYPERELDLDNGIVLCLRCHYGAVHAENTFNDQDNWKKFVPMFRYYLRLKAPSTFNAENQIRLTSYIDTGV